MIYYQDEFITLHLGDALEETQWTEADVLVTDPPYGIAWEANSLVIGKKAIRDASTQSIQNDESLEVRDAALALWGKKKPGIVFGTWKKARPENTTNVLIWHKTGKTKGVLNHPFFSIHEEIYTLGTGFVGEPLASVITTHEFRPAHVQKVGHPTPKPIDLMEKLVAKTTGLIADPFAGSGATLIAAKNLGRKAIGVELEEKYCEIIATRLSQSVFDFSQLEPVQEKEKFEQGSFI